MHTSDPGVSIEEQTPGYVRYACVDGRRWEVRGVCDRRGDCMIGAVIQTPEGLLLIERVEQLAGYESELDVPVGPGFSGCCPLEITVLAD